MKRDKKSKQSTSNHAVGALDVARVRLRPGFLVTFSVLGLLAMGGLVFGLSWIMGNDIKKDETARATQTAQLLASSSFGPKLQADSGRLEPATLKELDVAAIGARRSHNLQSVTVWSPKHRILYSTDHRLIGDRYDAPAGVRAALLGRTDAQVTDHPIGPATRTTGKQIDVTVPLYTAKGKDPAAAFEIDVPYGPVAKQISDHTKRIDFILIGAALLFYAALWPRLVDASKALKAKQDRKTQLMLRELKRGIDRDELVLHYQPKLDLSNGRIAGAEALLRWRHPRRGLVAPNDFLPAAAESDLIKPLTMHVLDRALRDCRAWRDRGIEAAVDVNLSVPNVLDDTLPGEIGRLLGNWHVPPEALGLEVTEGAITTDPDAAAKVLAAVAEMGVTIAIDDFGTGYTSLAGLRDLPVSDLKIDRSFVAGLSAGGSDATIVRSIIGLAHELGVNTTAEGVEDRETLDELARLHCDMAQGYYISKPMPLAELVTWFEAPRFGPPDIPSAPSNGRPAPVPV